MTEGNRNQIMDEDMLKMFSRIKTPEDFYKCHIAIILNLDETYLGGECNQACGGQDPARFTHCVTRLKPDYRDQNHALSYGHCFYDDKLTRDCRGLASEGCTQHDHAFIRGVCPLHKCTADHKNYQTIWTTNERGEETENIWTDFHGDCYSEYMIKGDPAVYADIGPRGRRVKLCDTLPKYIEKHLVPSRVSEAKTI